MELPPPIQRVYKFDKRIQTYDQDKIEETLTSDNYPLIVQVYMGWAISKPDLFFSSFPAGTVAVRPTGPGLLIRDAKLNVIARHPFSDFVSTDKSQLKFPQVEQQILQYIQASAATNYGINFKFVGIKKLALPESVTQKVFERMTAEREREIASLKSQGDKQASIIRNKADTEASAIRTKADAEATEIRGRAESEAAKSYAVFEQNPDLAIFLRELRALEEVTKEKTTLILDERTRPFDLLTHPVTNQLPSLSTEPAPEWEPGCGRENHRFQPAMSGPLDPVNPSSGAAPVSEGAPGNAGAPLPPPVTPDDAGSQALSEALRSSFAIVRLVMVLLVIVFFASGVFTVPSQEKAIVLRFGKPVGAPGEQLLGPGLHWSFPYPIDEVVRIPISQIQTVTSTAGWYATTPEAEQLNQEPEPGPSLNPATDGYALTGDGNIIHIRVALRYRVNDALKYTLDFVNASNLVQNALDTALIHSTAEFTVDQALRESSHRIEGADRQPCPPARSTSKAWASRSTMPSSLRFRRAR